MIGALTIGIPSFVLALENNNEIVKGTFLKNVLFKSVPVSFTSACSIILMEIVSNFLNFTQIQKNTIDVVLVAFVGFVLIYKICVPFTKMRRCLFYFCIIIFIICILFFRKFFSLTYFNYKMIIVLLIFMFFSLFLLKLFYYLFEIFIKKKEMLK